MHWEEIAIRLGVALLLGGIIGLERQWRSHYVGLRTNTLVTVGAAAMLMLAYTLPGVDPSFVVHIVAGIITGVGFLCGGVIIRDGETVKGFHTAASLWCSVAVGLFVGAGYFAAALMLAGCIVLVNLLLRPVVVLINEKTEPDPPVNGTE
jgi:putative Mg2+ transporter-C (MgtC) family protein